MPEIDPKNIQNSETARKIYISGADAAGEANDWLHSQRLIRAKVKDALEASWSVYSEALSGTI